MELEARAEDEGTRLDAFLAEPLGSRSRAARLIADGHVLVDGERAPKRHLMAAGERVTVREPDEVPLEPVADAPFDIAYQDDRLLVVDKPAGVVVHPARGHQEGTLAQALEGTAGGGEDGRAGIVHRLDKDTSGLLVVAKDEETHRRLRDALAARLIEREYIALVEGRPPARTGTIDAPIGRDRRMRTKHSTDTDVPRDAVTHFELDRALPQSTLLRVRLETGRTHQIRVHLQAIGHPVCGDPEYGTAGLYGLQRQFLHAARLAFVHPHTGDPVEVTSPLPEDLRTALERAES